MRGWAWLLLLAGCDRVLGLGDIKPGFVAGASALTVAAGSGHTCWIDTHGSLWCWGENDVGELGDGSLQVEVATPAPIDDQTWAQVSASGGHTCAIRADQTLWCWGNGMYGKLGTGSQDNAIAPAQITAPAKWLVVSAGHLHTCAIDSARHLWCWGNNSAGELGDGTQTPTSTPLEIGDNFVAVAAGEYHTCAIRGDGVLLCWGGNDHGQLGDGTTMPTAAPEPIGSDHWAAVTAGSDHTCGITATHHARCWGRNDVGQLGNAGAADATTPTAVLVGGEDLTTWSGIAANDYHTCAWDAAGNGYCWGDSSHGELLVAGDGINATPVAFAGGTWSAFAVGGHHVCALDSAAGLACAGANGWGQLGGGPHDVLAPTPIGSASWGNVTAGRTTTCVQDLSNKSMCGGNNLYGQLGDGTRTSRTSAVTMAGNRGWVVLAGGEHHACGIDNATPMASFCWGDDQLGQLGIGGSTPQPAPTSVALTAPLSIHAHDHTCALVTGGDIYCWGENSFGELGDGTTTRRATIGSPVPYAGGHAWMAVTTGSGFTCALDTTGAAWCWGRNDSGNLGNGMTTGSPAPTAVTMPSGGVIFSSIVAGGSHACALVSTGQAYCWGYNGEGQVGVGSSAQLVATPTPVSGHLWNSLKLGELHACALEKSTDALWCWGDNRRGELGNGDPQRQAVSQPQRIGTAAWNRLATGAFHTCALDTANHLFCWGSDDDGALLDGGGWTASLVQVPIP